MQTRPYQPTDVDDVTAMLTRIDVEAGRQAALTADLVNDFVGGMVADLATDSRVVFADGCVGAAGFVATPPKGGYRVDLVGGVLPEARGHGIGRTLLGWQLGRAEQIHAAIAADSPWGAHADVSQNDASALALMARFGLAPVRYSFDMVASTTNVGDRPAPEGVTITPYQADQSHVVYEAHMDAFADHWGFQHRPFEAWSTLTVDSAVFNPALSLVATEGTEVAGYLLAYDDAIADQIYIGQVGVRRPWRRRGLAAAMLAHLLRGAAAAGRATAALDVDAANPTGAVGVYERVGFQTEHTILTCGRSLN
jgi:mycothiol synthase